MILPRCKIDSDKCSKFLIALRHYHRKYSDKDRTFKMKPNHDFSSHFCDALRCLATGLEENKIINNQQLQQKAESNYEVI